MRILLVHKFFYVTGGADVFFFETGRVLKSHGHDIAYFSTNHEKNVPSEYSSYFVDPPQYRSKKIFTRVAGICNIVYSRNAKRNFLRLLHDFKPDIVHVFAMFTHLSPSILDACKIYGVPVVLSCNDYKHICPNYKLFHHGQLCDDCHGGKFIYSVTNRCCQDSLIFSVASALESYIHDKFNLVRNSVNMFLFSSDFMARQTEAFWGNGSFRWRKLVNPFNSSAQLLSESYKNYFIYFGRFVEEKGADVLLSAAAKVPEAKLIMIGDGPEDNFLRGFADELGLQNVEFVGPKWGADLNELLSFARFVVVPSVWHENFPYVILQSFAVGKPVIGADRGGIPELVRDGEFGYVYPALDSNILADRISRLWHNPELAVQMGVNAKDFVDSYFTDDNFYSNLIAIYKEVLS